MRALVAVAVVAVGVWLAFLVLLAVVRPDTATIKEAARAVPDALRLLKRLATDPELPRTTRLPVWLLVAYLAMPIDLVPDFVPVLGYADDVILVSWVLRRFVRRAGPAKVEQHWPGSLETLAVLRRMLRLPA